MRGLKNKVVIITGGGGGIGSATCERFAEEGAQVVVADINAMAAQSVVDRIMTAGGRAESMVVDLVDYEAVKALVDKVETDLGEIDVLVNNAGWDLFVPFLKTDPAYWSKLIDINLRSVLNITHSVLTHMAARNSGRVVSVASDAARVGSSGEAVYAACKAGVIALSKTLAREHARQGITFNCVCPGVTDTPMLDGLAGR